VFKWASNSVSEEVWVTRPRFLRSVKKVIPAGCIKRTLLNLEKATLQDAKLFTRVKYQDQPRGNHHGKIASKSQQPEPIST
jgi:hypothetical protein